MSFKLRGLRRCVWSINLENTLAEHLLLQGQIPYCLFEISGLLWTLRHNSSLAMKRRIRGNPEKTNEGSLKLKEFSATWNVERRLFCSALRFADLQGNVPFNGIHCIKQLKAIPVLKSFGKMLTKIPSVLLLAVYFHRESPPSCHCQLYSARFLNTWSTCFWCTFSIFLFSPSAINKGV